MTTAQMVAHVRTLFDEDSAGFYTDTMIKRSLDNGQKMLASVCHLKGKSHILYPLENTTTEAYSVTTLPTGFWLYKSGILNSYPLMLRTGQKNLKEYNSYLTGSSSNPYIYIYGSTIDFDPTPSSGTYTIIYYKLPNNLTTLEPNLPETTHPAICQYAFADLLLRDMKHSEGVAEMDKFYQMVGIL